jgi:t-SNARE complex subunit (syntaxin)
LDEVAPSKKLREYEAVALRHKDTLLKEAKILKVQFSEDMQHAQSMERTVSDITYMMGEFAQMIGAQSEVVETIGEVSKDSTESVRRTDEELLLTLERTQSHQWSMISLVLGLSVLLLLLDYLSP